MIEQGTSTGPIPPSQDEEQEKELENWRTNFQEQFKDIYVTYKRKDVDQLLKNNPGVLNDPAIQTSAIDALDTYLEKDAFGFNQAVALSETFLKDKPELFQTDEFKQIAHDNLLNALKQESWLEPERILDLKQRFLEEDPYLDNEFKSAATIGFENALKRNKPGLAKRIMDIFLEKNEEIQEIINQSFLIIISKGDLDKVIKFAQVFGLNPEEFKHNSDAIKAAEFGTIESLQGLAALNRKFYPDSLRSSKEFYRYFFGQDSEGFLKLSQQALIASLNKSILQNAVYLKTKVLNQNPKLAETDEIKKAAQNALEQAQKDGYSPKDIELITKYFL